MLNTFFCWQLILIFLYFKLEKQTNYSLAWVFFFRTLATAFATSYCMKTVCSCWVWKLVPSASFIMQSDWQEKKVDQLLCVRKVALGMRFMPLKLVSAIFCQIFFFFFHQMIALRKLWKMFFVSSKKLILFLRYSNFCNFFPCFPNFPDSKGQMQVE